MSILNIGLSSLMSTQYAITIASNNIANATVDGYSRQQLVTSSSAGLNYGGNYYGQGVNVDGVMRISSDYLEVTLRNTRASEQYYSTLQSLGVEVDSMFSDQETGLDKSIQSLYTALGDLANNPTSEATRTVLLETMSSLGAKFENMDYVLSLSSDTVDKELVAYTDRLNSLAGNLIDMNKSVEASFNATGKVDPTLLDNRNQILSQMAELTDIKVEEGENHSVSVFMGDGLALVANNKLSPIEAKSNGFSDGQYEVYLRGQEISGRISGGKLGGTLEYRNDVLNYSKNSLGQVALGLTQLMNAQHKEGFTPSGVAGSEIFANFSSVGKVHDDNAGTGNIAVSFDHTASKADQETAISQLEPREYEVTFNGVGYDVVDANTRESLMTNAPASFSLDGLDFDLSGAPVAGDKFKLSPMSDAISNYEVVINDTADIANASDPAGSISDNRNSLALFGLQNSKVFNGGLDTMQSTYSTLVAGIGSKVSSAQSASLTFGVLYDQANLNRESQSGVNSEEEASKLIQLQQQYSAAAKIINAAQQIFDDLLTAIN